MTFHFERSWSVPLGRESLWEAVADTERYDRWWTWLREYQPAPLEPGACAHAVVAPPLPYRLRLDIEVTDVEPARCVRACVRGDLDGTAVLQLDDAGTGTELTLGWDVELTHAGLRLAEPLVRPMLVWGHNWVVDQALASFLAHQDADGPVRVHDHDGADDGEAVDPRDLLVAAAVAAVVSGAPSTAYAVATRRPALAAARAAGSLLGRPSLARGLLAHAIVSVLWTAVLARILPPRSVSGAVVGGAVGGGAIAALDLGVVARRYPAIRALPTGPQVADHVLFGATVGAVLAARHRSGGGAVHSPR